VNGCFTAPSISDMLSNIHSASAVADRERLTTLDRSHTHLALARYHYANTRANVLYARLVQEGVLTVAGVRESSHMAGIINAVTITNDSAQCTKVNHALIAIEKRTQKGILCSVGSSDYLPVLLMPNPSLYVPPSVPRSLIEYCCAPAVMESTLENADSVKATSLATSNCFVTTWAPLSKSRYEY
jgi:hypothetical protein